MTLNDTVAMKAIKADLDCGLVPMLLGEPGIGKTSIVEHIAVNLLHTKCFVLPCNQLADKADLTGARLIPTADGKSYKQSFYPHEVISEACQYAIDHPHETPILFMDELNRTTPDVTSEALSIPTLRAIGSTKLPGNLKVMTAGNDKGNITSLDSASVSRFVLYHVEPDTDTWLRYMGARLNKHVAAVLRAHPELIFCNKFVAVDAASKDDDDDDSITTDLSIDCILDDEEAMDQFTTPRTLTGLSDWLNTFTDTDLLEMLNETHENSDGQTISLLQEVIEGHVGATRFTMYLMETLATALMTPQSAAAANITVAKPAVYDTLRTFTTRADLDNFVQSMSDVDRSACMLYSLTEHRDNTDIILAMAKNWTGFQNTELQLFLASVSVGGGLLDTNNVACLQGSNCDYVNNTLSQVMSLITAH